MNKLIKTADGSHTIYVPDLDETYHSTHGAIQEAEHVFLKMGLDEFKDATEVKIFEVGFGTGLNAVLTENHNKSLDRAIEYWSIEKFPVAPELIKGLNYIELLKEKRVALDVFEKIHEVSWDKVVEVTPKFSLNKLEADLKTVALPESYFDLIYFDAFGPRAQEQMWVQDIFEKIYTCLKPGGIMVTYSAKGAVKRTLKAVGFEVESLPGPPGKREMTRGRKI